MDELKNVSCESERVNKIYEIFDEDQRLKGKTGKVEFITTMHYLKQVLKPGDKVLDIGAGTGAYSFPLDRLGCRVTALELAERNVEVFRSKLTEENNIKLIHGNALDLSMFEDNSFDAVLLFGPLYHLEREEDRIQVLSEAKRVMKADGKLFAAYINHDFIPYTETEFNPDWFANDSYNHENFRIDNFPFVFFTLEECREMLTKNGLIIEQEIATDGLSELLAEKINAMSDFAYEQYLRYHLLYCEDIHSLRSTNHFLFRTRKK